MCSPCCGALLLHHGASHLTLPAQCSTFQRNFRACYKAQYQKLHRSLQTTAHVCSTDLHLQPLPCACVPQCHMFVQCACPAAVYACLGAAPPAPPLTHNGINVSTHTRTAACPLPPCVSLQPCAHAQQQPHASSHHAPGAGGGDKNIIYTGVHSLVTQVDRALLLGRTAHHLALSASACAPYKGTNTAEDASPPVSMTISSTLACRQGHLSHYPATLALTPPAISLSPHLLCACFGHFLGLPGVCCCLHAVCLLLLPATHA